jgi:hypothetical protein
MSSKCMYTYTQKTIITNNLLIQKHNVLSRQSQDKRTIVINYTNVHLAISLTYISLEIIQIIFSLRDKKKKQQKRTNSLNDLKNLKINTMHKTLYR